MIDKITPDIIKRSFDDILKDNKALASVYVPEWKPVDDRDLGLALLKIFSHMQDELYARLNRVPDKGFASFLDMIGVKLMPARPAKSPVTFYLAEGSKDSIFVPAGTQVATAETESHRAMTFETANSFTAIMADINQVYSVDLADDEIYNHSDDFKAGRPFRIFEGADLQEHALYIGHSKLFKLKDPGPIVIQIAPKGDIGLGDMASAIWSYEDGNGKGEKIFKSVVSPDRNHPGSYLITLTPDSIIKESQVSGISGIWIKCRLDTITGESSLPLIREIWIDKVSDGKPADPDQGFYNFLPLDLSKRFYPFGRRPRLYDSFYISSNEAFTKENAEIAITFSRDGTADEVKPSGDVDISWEYWNGLVWRVIAIKKDNNEVKDFKLDPPKKYSISFSRPNGLSESEVNGVKGYWIRARLVNGDYGSDKVALQDDGKTYKVTWDDFHPPLVDSVKISYSLGGSNALEHCLSHNNLEFKDVTALSQGIGFRPFIPLRENTPAIYIGFKEPLKKGNLSMYFSLTDERSISGMIPEVIWSHWTGASVIEKMEQKIEQGESVYTLTVASTDGLGAGTELLLDEDFQEETASEIAIINKVEKKVVYLRKMPDRQYTSKCRMLRRSRLDVQDNTDHLSTSGIIEILGPSDHQITRRFGEDRYWLMGTMSRKQAINFNGIYPNTVWAEQVESIKDEILGSSEGEKDSKYPFIKRPVVSSEVWVREGAVVSDSGPGVEPVKDSSGKVIDAWVKWTEVTDFFDSKPGDRHYMLDEASGILTFGDGNSGMIPPIGRDNVKASYRSGGGSEGNLPAGEINVLKTSIAGIDHVMNYVPAEGGSDTESMGGAFERGPYMMRTMDRAVTAEDFERLSKASSSYIARAKSLADGSRLKIVVIPGSKEDRPMPSPGLIKIVKEYLLKRSLSSISPENLDVIGPSYKEVRITVDVIPKSIDLAVPLERDILQRLRAYLHPLTGGPNGTGWEFGRPVHISDVYGLLEGTGGVDHVENLELNESSDDVELQGDEVACSGDHKVNMKLGGSP